MPSQAFDRPFLSWCLQVLGPALVVWFYFVSLHQAGELDGVHLIGAGGLSVAVVAAASFVLALTGLAGWKPSWRIWITIATFIAGVAVAKVLFLVSFVVSTPIYLAVLLIGGPLPPESAVSMEHMGSPTKSDIERLFIFGAPFAWCVLGGVCGGLLGWCQRRLFADLQRIAESWDKSQLAGGAFVGLGLGATLTLFALSALPAETEVFIASFNVITTFLSYIYLTSRKLRLVSFSPPASMPEGARLSRIVVLVLGAAYALSLVLG